MTSTSGPETVSDDALDYGDDAAPQRTEVDDAFEQLEHYVLLEEKWSREVSTLDAQLKQVQGLYTNLVEKLIPELMERMKLDEVKSRGGVKVTIKRDIRASLPSAKERPAERAQALAWLLAHGHAGVVKNKITVELDRGEDARAEELLGMLRENGVEATAGKDVHAGTLSALVRELLEAGAALPQKLLNVFDQKVAKLKRP